VNRSYKVKAYFRPGHHQDKVIFSYIVLFFGPIGLFCRKQIRLGIIQLALYFFLAFHGVPDVLVLATNIPLAFLVDMLREKGI